MIKKIFSFAFLSSLCLNSQFFAQETFTLNDATFQVRKVNYIDGDTISFLLCESSYSIDKPTIIYLPGSLPKPLVYQFEDGFQIMVPFHYFDTKELLKSYNLIVVGKPFTPIHAREQDLVNNLHVPDKSKPNCFELNYLRTDNLDYLGKRIDFLINNLIEQKLIDSKRIIVLGHSQGGREAPRVAALNKNVSDVVILSAGAYGRMQHILVDIMRGVLKGEKTFQEYMEWRVSALEHFKEAFENPDVYSCEQGSNQNVLSFAAHMFKDILQTSANIYYATGIHDIAALHADQLLIDCWMENKFNIVTKIYPNCEHSFIHVNEDGTLNYEVMYWNELMSDVLNWLKN
jgi:pimeloyl-ACP methyl ester carboxylesterase